MIEHGESVATSKDGSMQASFITVGPALAEQVLGTYRENYRKFRPSYAEGLARDMRNGFWLPGSKISFIKNDEGEDEIADGQHRFASLIESGTEQEFLVVTGLPRESYNVEDTNLPRNYGDLLRHRGYSGNIRPALVKLIHKVQNGPSIDTTKRFTNNELDITHDLYVDSIGRAVALAAPSRRKWLPETLTAYAFWSLSQIHNEKAYTFLMQVFEGEDLRNGMPAYNLRDRLIQEWNGKNVLTRMEFMNLIYDAWNYYVDGIYVSKRLRDYVTLKEENDAGLRIPKRFPEETPVDPNDYVEKVNDENERLLDEVMGVERKGE